MNKWQFVFLLWLAWGTVSLMALVFIVARPGVWASWIEKENNYWVARGRFSSEFAEKIKRLEKGPAMKLLLGANVVLSILVICLLFHIVAHRPLRVMMPPPRMTPQKLPAR
jgi:hypothetical protein